MFSSLRFKTLAEEDFKNNKWHFRVSELINVFLVHSSSASAATCYNSAKSIMRLHFFDWEDEASWARSCFSSAFDGGGDVFALGVRDGFEGTAADRKKLLELDTDTLRKIEAIFHTSKEHWNRFLSSPVVIKRL